MSQADDLLQKLLMSESRGELLVLFHKNPGLIDTPDAVAWRLGRNVQEIEGDINDLVTIGVLTKRKIGKSDIVYLNRARDKEIQSQLQEHIMSLEVK